MIRFACWLAVGTAGLGFAPLAPIALACPFCSVASDTISEQIAGMDAVVIAALRQVSPPDPSAAGAAPAATDATFEILEVIKGEDLLGGKRLVETLFFGESAGKISKPFFILGAGTPDIMWSAPQPLTDRARGYIAQLSRVPKDGPDRLDFFQQYLEDRDEMLSSDAYQEFARAPYSAVQGLRDRMNHERLVAWISDPNVSATNRRLYLTMLGVCGSKKDLPMLEAMLRSNDRATRSGRDAMIACYLTLSGASGMPLIEELFLKNEAAEYTDTYAAVMALRFHGSEAEVIPRARLLEGLRHLLDRPQLADLVIADLARWEDWSSMPRLVQLFKAADEKSNWVRVPVINFLRACPKPEAREYLQELERIDPAAVQRASTLFPFGSLGGAPPRSD